MAIIRWNPWNLQSFLEDDFDIPTIPGLSRLVGQGLNLYETEDAIVAEAAMPGVSEDKIDIAIDNGVVRVTGSSQVEDKEKSKRRYFMSSMSSAYNYSFRLPEGIIAHEEPTCELEDGVLRMAFAKAKKAPPKKVKVTKKTSGPKEVKKETVSL